MFGVSAEELTATCEAACIMCFNTNNEIKTPSFLVENFKKCLLSSDDATVEVS